jgi:ribosomal protein S18 acetylase RimI-like enzyme
MEDCKAFEGVTAAAFSSEPLIEMCFYNAEKESLEESAAKLLVQVEKKDDFLCQKAIDSETGEALGYSKWMLMEDPHKDLQPWGPSWPRGANVPLCKAMFGEVEKRREEYFKARNEPYVYMCSLMIMPAAQRRGVGSALLRAGLAASDAKGWKAYINASPSGAPLYRKFGWKDYTSVTVNLKDFGGLDIDETTIGLVREVGAKEIPRGEVAT